MSDADELTRLRGIVSDQARQIADLTAARDTAIKGALLLDRQCDDLRAARDAALEQMQAMAQPPQIQTSPAAHAQELAKIQAAIPPRNRVDVHADFPAEALRRSDGIPR